MEVLLLIFMVGGTALGVIVVYAMLFYRVITDDIPHANLLTHETYVGGETTPMVPPTGPATRVTKTKAPIKNTDIPLGILIPEGLVEGTFDCLLPTGDTE